jgi:two-component system sensor histidine kinase PilS (NtrC family)
MKVRTDRFNHQKLIVQGLRVGIFSLVLVFALSIQISQSQFYNWSLYWQFYSVAGLGIFLNLFGVLFPQVYFRSNHLVLLSFFADVGLISGLMYSSELSVSIYLFSFMLEIILVSLLFQTRGSFLLAAFSSLCFSLISLFGPEMKAMTFFFSLILYNISFFAMAWISGLLGDQLEAQGVSLSTLKALNSSIVETIPSALLTVQSSGLILSANPGASALFQIWDFEGVELNALSKSLQGLLEESVQTGLPKKSEVPLVRTGDNLILAVHVIPQHQDPGQFLMILEDITEVRRLELTVLHQQKLAAIGGLASGIAHELGNPLAAVSANIQFLEPKIQIEDETDRKLIQNTHKEIARLGRLIGEFKDFAKPEKIPVEKVRLDLLLQDMIQFVGNDKKTMGKAKFQLDIQEVPEIRGSRDKLYQAFLNVMMNSFHAVEKEEPGFEPWVQVACRVSGNDVVVRIRDNGVGMGLDQKTRLFEPFFTTKGQKGTGLGLAITYKIMQSHQAKISVDSTKGTGTEFVFRFPIPSLS